MSIKSVNAMITKPPIAEDASRKTGFVSQCEGIGGAETFRVFNLDKSLRSKSDDKAMEGYERSTTLICRHSFKTWLQRSQF